jgi:hypothetical protein
MRLGVRTRFTVEPPDIEPARGIELSAAPSSSA